jgi:hypothetical protein
MRLRSAGVSQIEKGALYVSRKVIGKLADTLQVDPAELRKREKEPPPLRPGGFSVNTGAPWREYLRLSFNFEVAKE